MALPKVGQTVFLDVREGPLKGGYQSRIIDGSKTSLFLETPMRINSTIPVTFDVGISFEIIYRALDGAECRFFTKIMNREVREMPMLEIPKPKLSEIKRIQRREFLRVPINVSVELSFLDSVSKRPVICKGMTRDISGGGMALAIEPTIPLRAQDLVGFRLNLPIGGANAEISGKGTIIRVSDTIESANIKVASMKFNEITEQNRQRVVKYTFARQIEISKKLDEI